MLIHMNGTSMAIPSGNIVQNLSDSSSDFSEEFINNEENDGSDGIGDRRMQ